MHLLVSLCIIAIFDNWQNAFDIGIHICTNHSNLSPINSYNFASNVTYIRNVHILLSCFRFISFYAEAHVYICWNWMLKSIDMHVFTSHTLAKSELECEYVSQRKWHGLSLSLSLAFPRLIKIRLSDSILWHTRHKTFHLNFKPLICNIKAIIFHKLLKLDTYSCTIVRCIIWFM